MNFYLLFTKAVWGPVKTGRRAGYLAGILLIPALEL